MAICCMQEIAQAKEEELPIIQQIAMLTWPTTFADILSQEQITYMLHQMYHLDSLREQMHQKGHVFLLAKEEAKYLGYASYELHYQGQSKTKIHKLYLLPSAQGKGVGKQLIQTIQRVALDNGDLAVSLNVNKFNRAIQFYDKIGFTQVAEENIPIGNGYWMEDIVMELPSHC